ncbi:amidohydrolase family protein, partial [Acidobacteriia bacterium AH_259_A11_L15]|nr:amidohydrolase family protein [Acidobacteriia bacterium AH_259_A11_L15]
PREMVVKTPVALRINLQPLPGFWSFPSSLMGVLAYVKQVYLDARHYDQAWSLYENDPRGRQRPSYDRTLEPIRESLAENWPVLIPGNRTIEIRRALELGEDVDARTLLYGGQQGYEIAEELARNNIPVLVSLKWPEKPKDADPEAVTPLRVLRFRVNAPTTPAAFEQAGVRFAFYSGGLGSPTEIMKNARKAIEKGLSPQQALRAFTLSPAEIFGVADRLGSLEPGKIANLVVTDGDLFGEKTKVKMVFIDGRKFETREPGRPEEPPTVDLTGRWELTVSTPQGPQEMTADLTMEEDGTLTGTIISPRGERPLTSGWVSGNKFSFTLTITMGPRTLEATYTGTVEGNEMSGTVSMGPFSADFTGTRPERARARPHSGWRTEQPGGRR